jgi:hypothetical protein
MSRTKKIPFADSLAIWAETADEQEIRDGAVMLGIYARQRKFGFAVRIEPVKSKPEELKLFKEPA